VVHVFDVSQTDGEPLSVIEVPVVTGEDSRPLFDLGVQYCARNKLSFIPEPKEPVRPETMGYFQPLSREIWVRGGVPQNQQTKSLFHEIAHSRASDKYGPGAEVLAESVAFAVCDHYGFDTGARSFPYVATWAGDVKVLKEKLDQIRMLTKEIIDEITNLAGMREAGWNTAGLACVFCGQLVPPGVNPEEWAGGHVRNVHPQDERRLVSIYEYIPYVSFLIVVGHDFPFRLDALEKLKPYTILQVHDDGDLTVRSAGKEWIVSTEGKAFINYKLGEGKMKHFEFTVVLSGYGKNQEEAWNDAVASFTDDPGSSGDSKEIKEENVEDPGKRGERGVMGGYKVRQVREGNESKLQLVIHDKEIVAEGELHPVGLTGHPDYYGLFSFTLDAIKHGYSTAKNRMQDPVLEDVMDTEELAEEILPYLMDYPGDWLSLEEIKDILKKAKSFQYKPTDKQLVKALNELEGDGQVLTREADEVKPKRWTALSGGESEDGDYDDPAMADRGDKLRMIQDIIKLEITIEGSHWSPGAIEKRSWQLGKLTLVELEKIWRPMLPKKLELEQAIEINSRKALGMPAYTRDPGVEAFLQAESPKEIEVFNSTVVKHYREKTAFHQSSFRVVKGKGTLVYLGCLKTHKWDGKVCSGSQTLETTIAKKTPGVMKEVKKLAGMGIKVTYYAKEGVTPRANDVIMTEIAEAIGKAEPVS
jgi:hypothetical protein